MGFQFAELHDTPTNMDTWEHLELYEALHERGLLPAYFPADRDQIDGSYFLDLYRWYLRIFYESPLAAATQPDGVDHRFDPLLMSEFADSKRFFFDREQRRRAPSLMALAFFVAGHLTGRQECLDRLELHALDRRDFECCTVCEEMRPNIDMRVFAFCGHRACAMCVYRMPREANQRAYHDMVRHRTRCRLRDPLYVSHGEIVPNFRCHMCRNLVKRVTPVFS